MLSVSEVSVSAHIGALAMKRFFVYILTNRSGTLYTGVTNDLVRRIYEHKRKLTGGFTAKYNLSRLVFFEETGAVRAAISRENQIKGWKRFRNINLIEDTNADWEDLSANWYEE